MTRNPKQLTIKDYRHVLREHFGVRKYRITSSGDIHVNARMPNSTEHGWYLFGRIGHPTTIEHLFGDVNL